MSNSGKIWDTREAYVKQRANTWETPGNRGMRLGGQTTPSGTNQNVVEFVDMISTGNTADFGDLSQARKKGAGAGGFTRILCLGGQTPSNVSTIDFVNPIATGNFSDFGELINSGQTTNVSHCNNVKTISADGSGDADGVVITHMASQGNSSSFQNRTSIDTQWAVGTGDNTRFLMAGNYPASNQIDSMSIATTGSAADFGDLTSSRWGVGTASNSTRCVFMGGNVTPGTTNVIDFVTTQSAGNAVDFGDLTASVFQDSAGASNSKTGIIFGYQNNTINSINIASTGNATDFGNTLTSTYYQIIGADNGGGGLPQEEAFPQRPSVNYMPGSGRGLFMGGSTPSASDNISIINIPTLGNSVDFGNLTEGKYGGGTCSSLTRGLYGGDVDMIVNIDAIELASFGNASDFGDLTTARQGCVGLSSSTRGVFAGGEVPGGGRSNVIDYVTIATFGNATDFGDLTVARAYLGAASSPVRGVFGGGDAHPSYKNEMDYITIASTGNAIDFGDLTVARNGIGATSSSTRAVFGGGNTGSSPNFVNTIDYITIGSTGNATDFGDLTVARANLGSAGNSIRATFAGGSTPGASNVIDYVTIASTGNAADFGDLFITAGYVKGSSDSHGGLQSS